MEPTRFKPGDWAAVEIIGVEGEKVYIRWVGDMLVAIPMENLLPLPPSIVHKAPGAV